MANTSETGHAKNVTNLESLITSIITFGTTYNPSRNSITPTALQTLHNASDESLNTLNIAQAAYSNAVAARKDAFKPFSQLVTRIYNSLKATDTTIEVDHSAQVTRQKSKRQDYRRRKESFRSRGKRSKSNIRFSNEFRQSYRKLQQVYYATLKCSLLQPKRRRTQD